MTKTPRPYLTPYQLSQELGADPGEVRDWLYRERLRGHDHRAPTSQWSSPRRPTYDAASARERWVERPGHGGRPPAQR